MNAGNGVQKLRSLQGPAVRTLAPRVFSSISLIRVLALENMGQIIASVISGCGLSFGFKRRRRQTEEITWPRPESLRLSLLANPFQRLSHLDDSASSVPWARVSEEAAPQLNLMLSLSRIRHFHQHDINIASHKCRVAELCVQTG